MADPFAVTAPAPASPGPGFLGIPSSSWQNLANFGANMSVAANARDANGFLTYGSGIAGPMGEAAIQTEKQARTVQESLAQQALVASQVQGQQLSNLTTALSIPKLKAMNEWYTDPGPNGFAATMGYATGGQQQDPYAPPDMSGARAAAPPPPQGDLSPYQGGGNTASAGGLTPSSPGAEGTNLIGDAVRSVESKGNYQATNPAGYVGAYQFGAANLQSAGLYKPASGEDIGKNQWQGQITIPGYQPMSVAQFSVNKTAQDAAWNVQQSNYWDQLQKNHLDSAIGMNVGGVQITQPALIAGAHFAGVNGVMQWAASGGRYNPQDSNGTHLTDYMNQINQQVVQQQSLGGYNPQTQLNAQDQPGPMLSQGIPTPGKNLQLAQQYYQRASRVAMLNPQMAAALQKEGDMYANMAEQATHPQDIRAGGLAVTAGGNVLKAGTPQMGYDQSGAAQLGNEQGSFSVNGKSQGPATWEPTAVGPAGGPGGTPPPAPVQGPQMGSAAPPVQPVQGQPLAAPQAAPADYGSQLFDSALLGKPLPAPPAANGVYGQAPPGAEEVMKNGTERIDQQQEEAETQARGAVQANALLQQMRNEGQTWQSNNFAGWKNDARKWAMTIGQQFGISDPRLEQQVGDFATFNKNAQQLIQERVRQVSPRASTQEYNMIASAMPNAEIGNNGLTQITAELQGANDYQIAYNQGMSKWRGAQANMTPLQQYHATLGGFDGPFISKVTPYAFMLNALGQTPDGQAQLHGLIGNLQKTPEGRQELQRLGTQIQYAQQAGLMNASGGGTGE